MSPTSRLISPTPRPRPNHDCSLACFWKGGKGLPSPAGQATSQSLRRRHSSTAVLIGSTRDPAVHCNPSHLPYAGSGAVVTSPARDTQHTTTHKPGRHHHHHPTLLTPQGLDAF
ncbi:hypothetical protein INS49_014656 [Diaporthe citri]|uniref:uncharacterized protein n=1 Tax=Diaporthe citri TaxID=83186 RepID=UPI001C7F9B44|nr:uncharacterized protein INS49_014656 [Diaporthe citri]KAG6356782.1 hypothetical protein INS49_014656 [Diaporthe citri]